MRRCGKCGVTVLGERDICPLCNCVLHEEPEIEDPVRPDGYPDIAQKTKKQKRVFWIIVYFSVLAEAFLIFINFRTMPQIHWSMVSGVAIAYVLFTLWELLNQQGGHIRKLYFQAVAVVLLLMAIDVSLGFQGWSVRYGLPCFLLGFAFVILICMIVNFANWQHYVTMQIVTMIFSLIYLVFTLVSKKGSAFLAWVAFAVCLIFWSTTMMIGGRKAENEVRRKFHL